MYELLKIFSGAWTVVQHAPYSMLIFLALNLVGYYLQWSSFFPNKLVPVILFTLGIALFCMLGSTSDLAVNQRNPYGILSLLGFIQGGVAWLLHGTLVQYLVRKFKIPDQVQLKAEKASLPDPPV